MKKNIQNGLNAMLSAGKNSMVGNKATDVKNRFVDFWDIANDRPCLPLEYLYGTRGLVTGKLIKLEAMEADGKSSFMFMNYAMAQRNGAYIAHFDSEGTPPPPDFLWHLGCNPEEVVVEQPATINSCLDRVKEWLHLVRKDIDADKEHPLIIGIDSISGLSDRDTSNLAKEDKESSIGTHARTLSKWLRDYWSHFESKDAILMVTGQLKSNINTNTFSAINAKSMVTIATKPLDFHATWVFNLHHSKYWVEGKGDLGECITIKCTKNKLASPNRQVKVILTKPEFTEDNCVGWNWDEATKDLLFTNPVTRKLCWPNEEAVAAGGWYRHPDIQSNKNLRLTEFIDEFFANNSLLMQVRANLRIRGFGLPFETSYKLATQADKKSKLI